MTIEKYSETDLMTMATIIVESFKLKINHLWIRTKQIDKAIRVIAKSINTDQVLVERQDGEIVGVATYQTKAKPIAIDISLPIFAAEFGKLSGSAKFICYKAYKFAQVKLTDEFLHLDLIAVAAAYRGQGIGHRLLAQVDEKAISLGKAYVELEVVGSNPKAKRLYNEWGYVDIEHQKMNLCYYIFTKPSGFSDIYIMRNYLRSDR